MDKEKISKYLEHINENLSLIKDAIDSYSNNNVRKEFIIATIERFSEKTIEAAIKINIELLKDKEIIVNSYFESFTNLSELNIFKPEFIKSLASTAGFRNRLAHEYLNLDTNITISSAKKILELYPKYVKKILDFLL